MIYFDNAATSFPKPPEVISEVNKCIKHYCGNPGRSGHRLSVYSSEKVFESRELVSALVGCDEPERVVFTQNASYALNIAIKNLALKGGHVLISDIEHNSVLRVVDKLFRDGIIEYSIFPYDASLEEFETHIRNNTTLVIANAVSNVSGCENSLKMLSNLRQKYNYKLVIDASQMLGHKKFSCSDTKCDVLCAPSHKSLLGIQGSGFCIFFTDPLPGSFVEGGSGNESISKEMPSLLPERFEAGTLSTPSIVSLGSGIKYLNQLGIETVEKKIELLTLECTERINKYNKIRLYGAKNGLVSFNIDNLPSHYVAEELDKNGICVRAGLHCAPLAHKRLGTIDEGSIRVSLSLFNTVRELDKFYKVIGNIIKSI